jgi:O-methyltransferase
VLYLGVCVKHIYRHFFQKIRIKILPFETKIRAILLIISNYKVAKYVINTTYIGDGILTTHNTDLLKEEKFTDAFSESIKDLPEHLPLKDILWRSHIFSWAYNRAKNLNAKDTRECADFVELGVWYGVLVKAALNTDIEKSKESIFYLCDPWGKKSEIDKIEKKSKYSIDIFDVVRLRFQQYNNVKLVRGVVPDVLQKIKSKKIAFLSIDMNGSKPERLALEFFWPKLISGGIIYLDDFGDFPELRKEVGEFLSDKSESLLYFPTGQALIIKD